MRKLRKIEDLREVPECRRYLDALQEISQNAFNLDNMDLVLLCECTVAYSNKMLDVLSTATIKEAKKP